MHCRLAVMTLLLFPFAVLAAEPPTEFRPLFDGQTLAGWVAKTDEGAEMPGHRWSVEEGILTAQAGSGWLSTKEQYGDFVLKLQWRIPVNGNSGVFVRVPELKAGGRPHVQGIEIQVLDDAGSQFAGKLKPWQYTGSIYGAVAAEPSAFRGAEEWNDYEITCRGREIEVKLNGKVVARADASTKALADRPLRGAIGLQNHGSGVEYRRIEIRELK
ncbi:MAG: DUF1080 domain-containing protein [Pirellulaceae bacterium]|nr:DUF1080 domain-containing protein [Pirellulaceae bacterium]